MKRVLSIITIWIATLLLWSLDVHYTLIDNDWIINSNAWWVTFTVIVLGLCYFVIPILGIDLTIRVRKLYE